MYKNQIELIVVSAVWFRSCRCQRRRGCRVAADAVSYSMPQGDARGGAELDLRDLTYDGTQRGGVLSGGLGQLMDGSVGDRHPRGADWVGWRNDSAHPRTAPVALVFRFAHVRNFSAVWLHCSNQFGRGVRVFREARVLFSVGGRHFGAGGGGGEVVFPFTRDDFMERSRPVIVPVPHRIAMYVRIELHFDDRWMMISEVSFVSGESEGRPVRRGSAGAPRVGRCAEGRLVRRGLAGAPRVGRGAEGWPVRRGRPVHRGSAGAPRVDRCAKGWPVRRGSAGAPRVGRFAEGRPVRRWLTGAPRVGRCAEGRPVHRGSAGAPRVCSSY